MEAAGLGCWLKERCQREGMSLRQASIKTGLSHTCIADLISGVRPSPESIRKLALAFSGSGDHQRQALEDELLVLAGYRTRRPEGRELNEPLAQLLDAASGLTERQTRLLIYLAEFLAELETKRGVKDFES